MELLAVIVNYRTASMTIDALRALMQDLVHLNEARTLVIDNDSRDGSYEEIGSLVRANGWQDRVSVVPSGRNGGLGFGINFAVRPALRSSDPPRYVYLLNSDAFVGPGAVRTLLEFMDRHPEVGIAGSYIHGLDGETHYTAFRFPTIPGEFCGNVRLRLLVPLLHRWEPAFPIPREPQPVDWLAGASMLVRREVFESIGLFDETFFLYYEETDFCLRARRAGWPTWYVPQSRVAHIGGGSTRFKDTTRPRAPYWFESRRYYFRKHRGTPYLWSANAMWVFGFTLWQVRRYLTRKPGRHPPRLLRDFVRHNFLPWSIRHRRAPNGRSAGG